MSNVPYAWPGARWGTRMGHQSVVDLLLRDGLECSFRQVHMIVHASRAATEFGITRAEQDEWALRSHLRATQATRKGYFAEEIVPVNVTGMQGASLIDQDEALRPNVSLEKLAELSPLHVKDGTVTAGNAPGVNDGAAAMVVMSEETARSQGLKPLATIVGHASVGEEARNIAAAPAMAIRKLLNRTSLALEQVDRFEINEAFAAVTLVSGKMLGCDPDRVNVNGGAIAIGHPLGASGTRILITLIHELRRIGGGYGIAAICSGAAQGDAVLLRVDP